MQMGSHVSVPTDGPGLNHEAGGAHKEQKRSTPPAAGGQQGEAKTSSQEHGQAEVNDWTETDLPRGFFIGAS